MAIIAELSTFPLGEGIDLAEHVKAAIRELEASGVKTAPGSMGTVIEAEDTETLLEAVRRAHEAVFERGAERVYTTLKIDDRRDARRTSEDKLKSVE